MRNISRWKKTVLPVCAAGLLAFAAADYSMATAWAVPSGGVCVTDNVVVRESAVSGAQSGGLSAGQNVSIVEETEGSDGKTWYRITYETNGVPKEGWVRGDLINTEGYGDLETEEPEEAQEVSGLQLQAGNSAVTLSDVPEEEAAKVSDRFVLTVCELGDDSVTAYQLATADELVAEDASLVDFYYVYGMDELGVSGWYVYDAGEGTLQRNMMNLQYQEEAESEEAEPEEDVTSEGTFDMDSITRMLVGALTVVCLLLLILSAIFSVRYRRLRRLLEEEEKAEENAGPETKKRAVPKKKAEPENRAESGKRAEPEGRAESGKKAEPENRTESGVRTGLEKNGGGKEEVQGKAQQTRTPGAEPETEGGRYGQSQMEDELEAILGETQREFSREMGQPQGKEEDYGMDFLDGDPASSDDFDKLDLAELERKLSRELYSPKSEIQEEEPDYYDDEDDDLEFL